MRTPHDIDAWVSARRSERAPVDLNERVMSRLPLAPDDVPTIVMEEPHWRSGQVALCGLAAVAVLTRVAAWLLVFVPIR